MKTKSLLLLCVLVLGLPWAARAQEAPKTLPYEYGFENNDLAAEGWTRYSTSSNTNIKTNAKRTGNYGFQFYYTVDPQYLISPELTPADNGTVVEFYYKTWYSNQTFQLGYSTTTNAVDAFTFGESITATDNGSWIAVNETLAADTKYVAIKYTDGSSYASVYFDDFSFEKYSEYPVPKNLVLTGYTSSTATLDWTERSGQDHWDIYYTTSGNVIPDAGTTPSVVNTATKPYTITGLNSGVTYHAYVRGNYNNGEHYSDWSNACDFEVGCYTPTIAESMATCNQAYFSWMPVGSETSWQVAFSDQQGFDPDDVELETVTMQYFIKENLETGITYYARVRAVCGEGDYSNWSEEVSMTTECLAPSNLRATSVSPSTATLGWQQGSNESQWQISYSTIANFAPENGTMITVNANTCTLEGLTVNTPYYAYVRAVCTETIFSDWSAICTFMPKYELTVSDNESNYNLYIPFYGSYVSYVTKSQFIIPASALTDLLYANINKLTFYAGVETANFGSATFDVLISELDGVTVFGNPEFFDWSEMTTVYSGSLSVSNNKMEINLGDASYQYMGGDLLIGFDLTNAGNGVTAYWYGAATTGYSAYGGLEMPAYSYSSYSRYKFIPKTTFSYTPGTAPTCLKPTGLSISQGSGTATLTWAAGDGETNWNVQYKTTAAADWSASIPVENTPTCTLSNLLPMTTYQVRVQADCGGGDVSGWLPGGFTTPCGPVNVPYVHDFDSDATGSSAGLPQCWNKINDAVDPDFADYPYVMGSNAHSGSNCLFFMRLYNSTALNQIAVLPEMDADVRTLQLSFYAKLGSGTNEPLSVGVMTDPEDASTFVKIEDVTIVSSEYAEYTVSFDAYEVAGRFIALKCERASSYNQIYVDDIAVTANGVCLAPTAPQISNVTAHTAVLSWTPGSDVANWQVQYKQTTGSDWSEPIAVSGTPSYTFSNLSAATTYQARVRTNCGNDNYSEWVEAENFTTDCGFITLPYSHDFDDDATGHVAPTCWHFSEGTYPYIQEFSSSAHSGSHYLQIKKNTDYASTLVLPAIDTDEHPINTLKLTFWAKAGQSSSYYDYLYAGVMTDPDDMSTFQSVIGTSTSISNSTYKQFEFYFDNWTGEGNYIALRYGGSTPYCIDDIEISVAPTCMAPLELSSNTTYAHEAYIRWKARKANQLDYQVSYSTEQGFDPADGTIIDVHFDSPLSGTMYRDYQLTCLNAETTYYFYVRTKCGENEYSDWSADYSFFTTDIACPAPYINEIHPKNTVADIYWYADPDDEWEFQYKESSSNEWITPTDFSTVMGAELSVVYRLTGLTPDTEYDIRLRQHCGMYSCPEVDDGYSDWATDYFTTGSGCWGGNPWMCTSHLGTQATLNWRNDAEASRWQIRYRLESEVDYPEGNIVTTEVLPEASLQKYTITGLQPNSTYYWEVRGYCDENSQSEWSSEDYFYTRSTDGFITVDKNHPYYEDFEDGMPADWGRMNLYNYDMEHYDTWEYITATSGTWEALPATKCISSCRENMSWASDGSMILMPAIYIDSTATSAWLSFWSKDAFNANDARGTKMIWVNDNYLSTEYTAFDLGSIYQKSSKAGYWRKCFVNLSDYIGQTIIIAFDYVVTHNYNNYDWWVDNVCVQVFDKVGGGENVTSGDWNNGDFWGGSTPGPDDDVIINANVTIPEGVVAEANNIVINSDTINTGGRVQKFGKLIIADGGQLITNNAVEVTAQKTITPWTTHPVGGWYFIASPVSVPFAPTELMVTGNYDLYRLNNTTWENFKNTEEHDDFTTLLNGQGYLYANEESTTLEFTGELRTYDPTDNTVSVSEGWNLIGNPYTFEVYPNTSYYVMNEARTGLDPQTKSAGVAVAPCEGIIVKALADGEVTFSKEAPAGQIGGGLQIALTQTNIRGAERIDHAIVSFNQGDELPKFHFGESNASISIPQNGEDYAIVSAEACGELPLDFKADENGSYILAFNSVDTEFSYLHLVDHLTGNDVDLLQTSYYTFDARHTDYASRFKLVFAKGNADMGDDFAFVSDGQIIVNGEGVLQMVDMVGRVILTRNANGRIATEGMASGLYVLRLIQGDNVRNQKIIIE